jgi:predicted RNA-binding Zn ribbon-like protein
MAGVDLAAAKVQGFALIGNELAVDFANTVYAPAGGGSTLARWADLVDFLAATGTIAATAVAPLRARQQATPGACALALSEALALRSTLRQILPALSAGKPMRPGWVHAINQILRFETGCPRIVGGRDRFRLAFSPSDDRPVRLLGPIVHSAARLIVAGVNAKVRKCANPRCILYFRDTSRTGRRRWCSMAGCGNRAKVSAFLARSRAKASRH